MTTLVDGTVPVAADFNGNFTALNNQVDSSTGTLLPGNGTAAAPTHSFTGDTDTGLYRAAANTAAIAAGGVRVASFPTVASAVNYVEFTAGAAGAAVSVDAAGSDTNINLDLRPKGTGDVRINTANRAFIPAAVSGVPAQHGLFQENVVKGWLRTAGGGTPTISDSFNVTSITDAGVGDTTITWDRDFVNSTYVVSVTPDTDAAHFGMVQGIGVGSCSARVIADTGVGADPTRGICVVAIGDQ